jgi:hypothetical protein
MNLARPPATAPAKRLPIVDDDPALLSTLEIGSCAHYLTGTACPSAATRYDPRATCRSPGVLSSLPLLKSSRT